MEGSCSYAMRKSIDAPNQREKLYREDIMLHSP